MYKVSSIFKGPMEFKLQWIICVSRCFKNIFCFDTQITDSVIFVFQCIPMEYQLHGSIGTNFWDPQGFRSCCLDRTSKAVKAMFPWPPLQPVRLGCLYNFIQWWCKEKEPEIHEIKLDLLFQNESFKMVKHTKPHGMTLSSLAYPFASKFRILQLH